MKRALLIAAAVIVAAYGLLLYGLFRLDHDMDADFGGED